MHLPVIEKTHSGLTIASDFIASAETVAICIFVKTGSRHETKEQNGLSHFLEHMAFKGTTTRSAKEIAEEFDAIGGQFNAYTSHEETVYYAKVLKQDWLIALDILTDIIQNSTYDSEEMEKERGVILQEIAQYQDMPDSVVSDNFQAVVYPDQALGRTILGTADFISKVGRDAMVEYVSSRYHTQNIIVTAAGNIKHNDFSEVVQQKLSKLPTKGEIFMQPSIYRGGESRQYKDLEQVNIYLGFKGMSYLDDNFYTQRLTSLILGGGMSSRLFQEVREKRGLAYHISAFPQSYMDSGVFSIFAGTSEKDANELLDVSIEQMHMLCNEVTTVELTRAKTQIKASMLMGRESVSARSEKLAANIATFGRYITVEEVLSKLECISEKDVAAMMKNIISREEGKATIASLGKIDTIYSYEEITKKISGL